MSNIGSIKGTVKNKHGAGQPGATVSVKGTNLITVSDNSGAYHLDDVPAGEREVTVDDVLAEQTKTADIPAGGTVTVDFVINPLG